MADYRQLAASQMAGLAGRTMMDLHGRLGGVPEDGQAIGQVAQQLWQVGQVGAICISVGDLGIPQIEALLTRSPLVQSLAPGAARANHLPLVLQNRRLYSLRHWKAEQKIAAGLLRLASQPLMPAPAESAVSDALNSNAPDPLQAHAVLQANRRALLVLSGGPGTGKTTTLGGIVRLLFHRFPDQRIALTAPTGKAAARLVEAISTAKSHADERPTGTLVSGTLHRLLGYRPDGGFAYGRDNPLPFDLIIVDECSMVDAMLGARLIDALAPGARLVLAGDRNQLSSVEPGAFFGAVCAVDSTPVSQCTVVLETNYRQSDAPQIVAWADAVRHNELSDELPPTGGQVQLFEHESVAAAVAIVEHAVERYWPLVRLANGIDPDKALDLLRRFQAVRVLSVLRSGPVGVEALNERIASRLQELTNDGQDSWFAGRLVIVTRNMPALGLFNGDIGLTIRDRDGSITIVFDMGGSLQTLLPLQMPPHTEAFALTVHQSQGSDFDEVLLLPAPAEHPLATRSGLYTAITRARSSLRIYALVSDLRWASATSDRSDSALTERIAQLAGDPGSP